MYPITNPHEVGQGQFGECRPGGLNCTVCVKKNSVPGIKEKGYKNYVTTSCPQLLFCIWTFQYSVARCK